MFSNKKLFEMSFYVKKKSCPNFSTTFLVAKFYISRRHVVYIRFFHKYNGWTTCHQSFNIKKKKRLGVQAKLSFL